jgi:hypothetical protein
VSDGAFIFEDDPDGTLTEFLITGNTEMKVPRVPSVSFQKWLLDLYLNEGQTTEDLADENNWFVYAFNEDDEVFTNSVREDMPWMMRVAGESRMTKANTIS